MSRQEQGITRREFLRKAGIVGLWAGSLYVESNLIVPSVLKMVGERLRSDSPPELKLVLGNSVLFGVAPHDNDLGEVTRVESALGWPMQLVNFFTASLGEVPKDIFTKMETTIQTGRVPIYSWYPGVSPLIFLPEENIRKGARELKSLPGVILFRPLYEMNGTWFSWHNENTPGETITCWKRIRKIFREEQVENVKFIFSPNVTLNARPIQPFFPGYDEIDATALDIYDRYNPSWLDPIKHLGVPDLSPKHLIGPDLSTLLALAPHKPFLITEIGSMYRPEWVTDAIHYVITHMPNTIGVDPFDWDKEGKGMWEKNWQIVSDPAAIKETQAMLNERYFYRGSSPQDMIRESFIRIQPQK